ncbi:MAG: CAP domain-containing protein [Deltaproteobacteria bacterium]|nr:CAP domain-containing protein [Deltaproteobacteria bacterium]
MGERMAGSRLYLLIVMMGLGILPLSWIAEPSSYSFQFMEGKGSMDLPASEKAWRLYELANRENRRLKWDECLAVQAMKRARMLLQAGTFQHRDPWTGENEAWLLVEACHRCSYAGENLTKGYQSPEETHRALMESPEHRRNILNPRFQFLGVGCHDYICVQLFAGY